MSAPPISSRNVDLASDVANALLRARVSLDHALPSLPETPGLYAIHGSTAVWAELELETPPDSRPLYVGKSESNLYTRDVVTHFGNGRTGSSTVRRSFAALLHDSLDLRGVPRNPDRPERCANFGLTDEHDRRLTQWMRSRLELAIWERDEPTSLDDLETRVLNRLLPPVNISKVRTPWSQQVRKARRVMAAEARAWARARGFEC